MRAKVQSLQIEVVSKIPEENLGTVDAQSDSQGRLSER